MRIVDGHKLHGSAKDYSEEVKMWGMAFAEYEKRREIGGD